MVRYPPFIADTVPAFTSDYIRIPFEQNPAVDFKGVTYFSTIVKEYASSKIIAQFISTREYGCEYDPNTKQGYLKLHVQAHKNDWINYINNQTNLSEEEKQKKIAIINDFPKEKQYYKFQISYTDEDTCSRDTSFFAYSTVSIGRCIGENPSSVFIKGANSELNAQMFNADTVLYTGIYQTSLTSEPVYSYRFVLLDEQRQVVQDTGELRHNVDLDEIVDNQRTTQHEFKIKRELEKSKYYTIQYSVKTINGYEQTTPEYKIIKLGTLPSTFSGGLYVSQSAVAKENGYVELQLQSPTPNRGTFIIERTKDKKEWDQLLEFTIDNLSKVKNFSWKDFSVEQGVKYTYSLRQKANNQLSTRILSNTIEVDFQDMFLSDGKRQLKIAFNPKVSSFKNTILEQKTDTIGGKYPLFFRNGSVQYKEIPISGLISYYMDDAQLFITNEELGLIQENSKRPGTPDNFEELDFASRRTTALTNSNYEAERRFKLKVLDWLTNGELKLFRSPTEGNYVVRLMNTSLSPNDTLGRLLHTFTSTGYEAMNNDLEDMKKCGLVYFEPIKESQLDPVTITLNLDWYNNDKTEKMEDGNAIFAGDKIENIYWFNEYPSINETEKQFLFLDEQKIYNTTGLFTTPPNIYFKKLIIPKRLLENGNITLTYQPEITEEMLGVDVFSQMAAQSIDLMFSAPLGRTLWSEEWNSEINAYDGIMINSDKTKSLIYKTYLLRVQRDMNADENDEFNLTLTDGDGVTTVIDCSDGQIRTYSDLDPLVTYEKDKGLHLDIYARVYIDDQSSQVTAFARNY